MTYIEKPWGSEKLLEHGPYTLKELFMKKEHRCSKQFHDEKIETIYVVDGVLEVRIYDQNTGLVTQNHLVQGNTMTILPGQIHRMRGITNVTYLEASTPELDDVVRLEDDYGRVE